MSAPSNRPVDYTYYFPWLRLFRSARIAADPKKLLVASIAVTLLLFGQVLIGSLLTSSVEGNSWSAASTTFPWQGWGIPNFLRTLLASPAEAAQIAGAYLYQLALPMVSVVQPGAELLRMSPTSSVLASSLQFVWAVLVWTFAGSILSRMVALEFAVSERSSIWSTTRFAGKTWLSQLSALLLPISGLGMIALACAMLGLLGLIPVVGPWIVAILFGLAIFAGMTALLILYGLVPGWPMMVAALSVEGSDAFDGFSRSYSYFLGRPWMFLWYVIVAAVFGIVMLSIVDLATETVLLLAYNFISIGGGAGVFEMLDPHGLPGHQSADVAIAGRILSFWIGLFYFFVHGFAVSYFWSSVTIIYFLLRRADDATHFDEVYREQDKNEDQLAPLAGIAATDQPVTEVSHHPTAEGPKEPQVAVNKSDEAPAE
ncbi:hypothetical protein [Calycomorphotria hydatis]|uniref:Uncharacterized protein n=1 Tax=Calycomorphotria hydatis TaxID=2528027 RepID=A0A517TC62_9PLAN|nr:hypothetical protein [Calycomorphotria hydatis]QDT65965.1 hypothetical protein V22_32290 [Calycomorphotria hydatis]